jgi:CHRD domain
MRRSLVAVLTVGAVLVVLAPSAWAADNFQAPMSGGEEVPEVDTQATGVAKFKVREAGLTFKVNVANIENVFAAHIHCGAVGTNGPVGVTLFTGSPASVNGTLAEGVITEPDPGNLCGWVDLDDVLAAMENGETYANVHTTAHAAGEIRGQIK